ncbi:MAG: hypothetical protein EBY20_00885 [Alphaproteobacteria bacterium]|jgi:hypothetical protein|uniref:Uncharacterized protein n=1 Tax=viral metagenome TaxID=1070528 RepID=A0A6C0HR08_9ZZZZ|nr:hypothetical protein [Alphaproteobacteria bacterium]
MDIKNVLLIIIIVVLLYVVIRYIFSDSSTLSSLSSGTTMQTIAAKSLTTGSVANSSNFTYSIWFYVNDWNYKYGENKVLFGRMGGLTDTTSVSVSGVSGKNPCPTVVLGSIENNLSIMLTCYPGSDSALSSDSVKASDGSIIHTCSVTNVPIQKWVNLLISTYGRTLDVYLDGKLVKTCVLPGVAKINQNADVYVTPAGGFAGWTSKFQYFPNSTNPQTAWNIYQKGYGKNWLSNLFGKYQVKVTFSNNGTDTGGFTI